MKKLLKILAGITALALIVIILFIANTFVGNPISAFRATKDIKKYVDEKYPDLNLEVYDAEYNFKYGGYMATARSKTSKDTYFSVFWRGGEVYLDYYEDNVLNGENTLRRMGNEITQQIKPLLSKINDIKLNQIVVTFDKEKYINSNIELDIPFDKSLPLDFEVIIRAEFDDESFKNFERIFTEVHKILNDNGYKAFLYSIQCSNKNSYADVNNVSPSEIESGNLELLIKEAYENKDLENKENKISVYIKNSKTSK